jgi:hypothetical protein
MTDTPEDFIANGTHPNPVDNHTVPFGPIGTNWSWSGYAVETSPAKADDTLSINGNLMHLVSPDGVTIGVGYGFALNAASYPATGLYDESLPFFLDHGNGAFDSGEFHVLLEVRVPAGGGSHRIDSYEMTARASYTPAPEPSTITLSGIGTLGLVGRCWRRRKRGSTGAGWRG